MSATSMVHLRGCTLPLSALLVICTVALSLFTSAVDARPSSSLTSHSLSSHHSYDDLKDLFRTRRTPGFKQGAIDRVGHGFGKRSTDLDELLAPPELEEPAEFAMTDEYLAKALTRNPELTLTFVRQYIDINNDGLVTPDELQTFFMSD